MNRGSIEPYYNTLSILSNTSLAQAEPSIGSTSGLGKQCQGFRIIIVYNMLNAGRAAASYYQKQMFLTRKKCSGCLEFESWKLIKLGHNGYKRRNGLPWIEDASSGDTVSTRRRRQAMHLYDFTQMHTEPILYRPSASVPQHSFLRPVDEA